MCTIAITRQIKLSTDGNKTEWSPIRSVLNHTSDNKMRESDLFITNMITVRIERHEVNYNFAKEE